MDTHSHSKIKVGFVGLSASAAWASTALAPALIQPALRDIYDIVAVSTTSETSAATSANKYSKELGHPIKPYYGDASKIASDPDVDLVAVSVKAPYHKDIVLSIIAAKKDFFVEWPAGSSTEDTEAIADAAGKQGVRSIIGLQGRHALVIRKVKELLGSGIIGTVRSTNIIAHVPKEICFWAPFNKEQHMYVLEKKNGAGLLGVGIAHQLDTVTHLLGDFVDVIATAATFYPTINIVDDDGKPTGKTFPSQQPDHYAFSGLLKSGVLASVLWRSGYVASEGRRQFIWEIEGEEGSIRLQSNDLMGGFPGITESELYLNGKKVDFETPGNVIESCGHAWKEFANRTVGTYATIDDALKHHRLLDAIETSAKEGRRITL